LYERLGDVFVAGVAFPVAEDVGESADDGGVVVVIGVLEPEEFAKIFEGGLHEVYFIMMWRGYIFYAK
jgi:hypothetical protein